MNQDLKFDIPSDEQKNPNVKYTDISKAKARAASEN